ncbi:MAG: hypothetical protein ABI360_09080 [Allobranchiibius sp.]
MNTADVDTRAPTNVRETRGFWRVLLAIVLPIPWLAKGIQYIVLAPASGNSADQIKDWTQDRVYSWVQWLDVLFVVLVVPSIITMALVSRRGAPRLATAAAIVMGGGFLMVLPLNIGGDPLVWVAARQGYDPTMTGKFIDALREDPRVGLGGLGFITAITIGSVLIGLALWKSRAVPAWAAALVGLGGLTHPFLSFEHHIHGAGLVVLAIGCAAVGTALLKMSNDEYDLPPLAHGQTCPARPNR